ncbi:MAG: hypothetical protein WD492_11225 [Alkalispirochaeta sp.]
MRTARWLQRREWNRAFELLTGGSPCIAFRRTAATETVTVVVNLSSEEKPLPRAVADSLEGGPFESAAGGTATSVLLSNSTERDTVSGVLAPWEARGLLHRAHT